MKWDLKINIEKMSSDFDKSHRVNFRFENGSQTWSKAIDARSMYDEKERRIILQTIARAATDEFVVPVLVDGMLHALVSAALKGENPLE